MRQRVKNGRITNRKRDFIGKHIRNGSHASEIPNGCDVKEDTIPMGALVVDDGTWTKYQSEQFISYEFRSKYIDIY